MGPSPKRSNPIHWGIQRDLPQIPVPNRDPNMGGTPKMGSQKWVPNPIVTSVVQTDDNVI